MRIFRLASILCVLASGYACTSVAPITEPDVVEEPELPEILVVPSPQKPVAAAQDNDAVPIETEKADADETVQPTPAEPARITIVATGDMMLGGTGTEFYQRDNYDYAFKNVSEILGSANLFVGNVETALTNSEELLVDKKYRFKNPPQKVAAALARAGMDVANLANNHSMDYGSSGLDETLLALDREGIRTIGAGENLAAARRAAVVEVEGISVGFLAYSNTFPEEFWATETTPGTAFGHEHHVREDVQGLLQDGVDMVMVSFHWGREGSTELRPYQTLLARAAIDAGAKVVIGHHPHILQAVERYGEGVIFYSLGNFTFGSYSRTAKTSAIARVVVEGKNIRRVELIPIDVFNPRVLFQPRLLGGKQAAEVVRELQTLSQQRDTAIAQVGEWGVLEWRAD